MSTPDEILPTLQALLSGDGPFLVAEADQAIWDYLAAIQGLEAQTLALKELAGAVENLPPSSHLPALLDIIERHRRRLGETAA